MKCVIAALCLLVAGCLGPISTPMVARLDEEEQAEFDEAWDHMLTPPDKVDRTLLLDVILAYQLHQLGVDSLDLISRKHVGHGVVVMEVRFNREIPAYDEFTITYIDNKGREARRERFGREDIEKRLEILHWPPMMRNGDEPVSPEESRAWREAQEARMKEIEAVFPLPSMREKPNTDPALRG